MSGPANPFRPAEKARLRVKCLVYGSSGVGKTYFALGAPGPIAVIDTEGGTDFYAGRKGLSAFDVLPTKTFAQVEQAVAFLKANPDAYATLVIDPVTVLYQTLQDAAQQRRAEVRRDADADMEQLDWQRVKRAYSRLMNDLVNLPMHVIVTAREAELTEERVNGNGRKERVKIGWKPDAEKSTTYHFDTVLRLVPSAKGREAIVEKDRTDGHALGAKVPAPSFDALFAKVLSDDGAERQVPSDAEAARIDAATTMSNEEAADREETLTPLGHIVRQGAVAKGEGIRSDLFPRPQPDGNYAIGFLLEVGDGKDRPQCVASGPIGTALFMAADGDPSTLHGLAVTVEGDLFEVTRAGRRKLYRLLLTRIEGPEWSIPAPETADPEPPAEAPSLPLFSPDEEAAIDVALATA